MYHGTDTMYHGTNNLYHGIFKHIFIDIQTSKELIQIDINKKMRNGILTMNGEHTQSEN